MEPLPGRSASFCRGRPQESDRPPAASVWRYMRALPVQEFCLNCHGMPDQLSPAVKERLRELYPDDKGVGYSVGQIRGAMTISKPQ